jgi:hypothetical protein
MANRYLRQFFYTMHAMPVLLDCNASIGAAGAPSNLKGPGVQSITRLSAGRYQVKLQDNYKLMYGLGASLQSPVTGADIDPNAAVVGTVYQITIVGDSDWSTAGLPAGLTPTAGQVLQLAAAPAAGTGRVKAIGASGIDSVEILGNTADMLNPLSSTSASAKGGYVTLQCLAAGVPTDPADGSKLMLAAYLSNSSVQASQE